MKVRTLLETGNELLNKKWEWGGVGDVWYLLDCYDNYSTCGAKKSSVNLLILSTASIDIPLGYIPKGEKHIEWRVVCNRCADLCWYCDRPWNTKHLRREELEGWWILQKHSRYCKITVNTVNINIVTNRGIWNIHGGKLEISKDDEYCNNTAAVNWESWSLEV